MMANKTKLPEWNFQIFQKEIFKFLKEKFFQKTEENFNTSSPQKYNSKFKNIIFNKGIY